MEEELTGVIDAAAGRTEEKRSIWEAGAYAGIEVAFEVAGRHRASSFSRTTVGGCTPVLVDGGSVEEMGTSSNRFVEEQEGEVGKGEEEKSAKKVGADDSEKNRELLSCDAVDPKDGAGAGGLTFVDNVLGD